ncbi:MAG: hypothetical protein WBD81_00400 [Collimonas pratensis]|uniref:hypothetical protein n=1 Tax=Collimonas pratensis TaxID=279113 RepID=UPI003C730439
MLRKPFRLSLMVESPALKQAPRVPRGKVADIFKTDFFGVILLGNASQIKRDFADRRHITGGRFLADLARACSHHLSPSTIIFTMPVCCTGVVFSCCFIPPALSARQLVLCRSRNARSRLVSLFKTNAAAQQYCPFRAYISQ